MLQCSTALKACSVTSPNKHFDFSNLLWDAIVVEGTEDGDDVEDDLFNPLPTTPLPSPTTPLLYTDNSPKDLISAKKNQSKNNKKAKKMKQDKLAGFGGRVKASTSVKHHVHPSIPVKTSLEMLKLWVTKPGYIATRDENPTKVVYRLEEMIGEHSKFQFKLEAWDGW